MSRLSCIEVGRNIWRYVDREMTASDLAAISSHIESCDACRMAFHESAREANDCRLAFADAGPDDHAASRIVAAMSEASLFTGRPAERSPDASFLASRMPVMIEAGVMESAGGASAEGASVGRGTGIHRVTALAAVLLVIVSAGILSLFLTRPTAAHLGGFEATGGRVSFRSGALEGDGFTAVERGECWPGSVFRVEEGVRVVLSLETTRLTSAATITLEGPAEFSLDRGSTRRAFLARLSRGLLEADVQPRNVLTEPFEITTPHSLVRVVGTSFALTVGESETRLSVGHGKVAFNTSNGAGEVLVTSDDGERVMGAGGIQPVAPETSEAFARDDRQSTLDESDPDTSDASAAATVPERTVPERTVPERTVPERPESVDAPSDVPGNVPTTRSVGDDDRTLDVDDQGLDQPVSR